MPRRRRVLVPNTPTLPPGREPDSKYMAAIKSHLIQAIEATDFAITKDHVQALITMIGYNNIKLKPAKLVDIISDIHENKECMLNGCRVGVTIADYHLGISEQTSLTLELIEIDD